MSKLTALELDARKAGIGVGGGVAEEGQGEATGGAGKAYLSLEEYKEAAAAGLHVMSRLAHLLSVPFAMCKGCRPSRDSWPQRNTRLS